MRSERSLLLKTALRNLAVLDTEQLRQFGDQLAILASHVKDVSGAEQRLLAASAHQPLQPQRLLDSLHECAVLSTSDGYVVAGSPSARDVFGDTISKTPGQPVREVFGDSFSEPQARFWTKVEASSHSGPVRMTESIVLHRKNGTAVTIELRLSSFEIGGHTYLLTGVAQPGCVAIGRFVREEQEFFRELTDALPNLAWQLMPSGETLYVNRRWRDYFGRANGMTPEEWKAAVHPEDLENFFGSWQTVNDAGLLDPLTVRFLRRDGEYRWFSKRARAVCDETGALLYWIFTATDIHTAKETEEALRLEKERMRMAINAAQIGVWEFIPSTEEFIWDEGCRAAFAVAPEIPINQRIFIRSLHPDDAERVQHLISAALDPAGLGRFETEYRAIGVLDGVVRYLHAEGQTIFEGAGRDRRAARFIGIIQDNTVRKQAEDELRHANLDLQQFAYAAAHDLQEPLRNISLSLGLLRIQHVGNLGEPAVNLVETSIEGAKRIHGMVTDLLAFTRVTTHGIADTAAPVDANQVLRQVLTNLATTIVENEAEIKTNSLPPLLIHETHLVQLFQNIIGNAIKYRKKHEKPQIEIKAERRFGNWQVSVADNGIGFDGIHSERIFGVFKRLHHRHEYPGTGIGLAICSRIVTSYGGKIWAEGKLQQGATIHFTLPAKHRVYSGPGYENI